LDRIGWDPAGAGRSAGEFWAPAESRQGECILAAFRLVLVAGSLAFAYASTSLAPLHFGALRSVLLCYLPVSAAMLGLACTRNEARPLLNAGVQVIDTACAALAYWLGGDPNGPLFLLLVFSVAAAAYRWGWVAGTVAASASVVSVCSLQVVGSRILGVPEDLASRPVSMASLAGMAISLLGVAGLLGSLSKRAKAIRGRQLALERVARMVDPDASVQETIAGAVEGLAELAGAKRTVLALREVASGRVLCWDITDQAARGGRQARFSELAKEQQDAYFFQAPESSWCTKKGSHGSERTGRYSCLVIDATGKRLPDCLCEGSTAFFAEEPFQELYTISLSIDQEWTGRLFFLDPRPVLQRVSELRFLQSLAQEMATSLHAVYHLKKLQDRARAQERMRVAHELHDGLVQSLIALEMETALLRRRAEASPAMVEALGDIRRQLQDEIAGLRNFMNRLKATELTPREMLNAMSEIVTRFSRETGVSASFVYESQEVELPPRVCQEVVCILQEALANVRKHSGARSVQVRFASRGGGFELVIADDGQGFPFAGRRSLAGVERAMGPVVLQERAQAIGAQVAIESAPGQGSRVEIRLEKPTGRRPAGTHYADVRPGCGMPA
jgi:signal transduction histidine kinase